MQLFNLGFETILVDHAGFGMSGDRHSEINCHRSFKRLAHDRTIVTALSSGQLTTGMETTAVLYFFNLKKSLRISKGGLIQGEIPTIGCICLSSCSGIHLLDSA